MHSNELECNAAYVLSNLFRAKIDGKEDLRSNSEKTSKVCTKIKALSKTEKRVNFSGKIHVRRFYKNSPIRQSTVDRRLIYELMAMIPIITTNNHPKLNQKRRHSGISREDFIRQALRIQSQFLSVKKNKI
mmetsp:Transcript_1059/g.1601  ORF Transcript_1059/g.1601 Transcript_1059/m.1601 type:complete len:131 (+) Transcript_1059:72-464(+)